MEQGGRLSLDLRAEFPQSEGFSRTNLYDIKRWFAFYSSQIEFVHQAGGQLQKVDYANTPMPEILLFVPWRHQTIVDRVYDACKFACLHANMFCSLSRRFILCFFVTQISQMTQIFLATADVSCTYYYFQNIMDCIILCHIFQLNVYFSAKIAIFFD